MKKTTILFLIAAVTISCSKKDDEQTAPIDNTVTVNSTHQVNFKLDGVSKSYVEGILYEQYSDVQEDGFPPPASSHGSWWSYFKTVSGDPVFDLTKGNLWYVGDRPDSTIYYDFFAPDTIAYVADPHNQMGVHISYYISGAEWNTDLGGGDQTGSYFIIQDRKKHWVLGTMYVTIMAKFNCNLYDGTGNTKVVTDGVFVGEFANLQ